MATARFSHTKPHPHGEAGRAPSAIDADDSQAVDPKVWPIVWTLLVGALAVLFDTTIVAVALNTIASDLSVSVATIQWVSTAYLLAMAAVIPLNGWAMARIGGRRLWLLGLVIFLVGSVAASLAPSAPALIAFRVVQGVGGGILMPLTATLVMQAAGGRGIGRIMSVVSLPAILGPVLGPVLGGLIVQHLHWSWMFWVNVPLCILGIILAIKFLPKDAPSSGPGLDPLGLALMAPGLGAILLGLSRAAQAGTFAEAGVLWLLALGVAAVVAFAIRSLHLGDRALIDVRLLRHWPLASSALLLFLAGVTLYGSMLVIPLYFQQLQGLAALTTGLALIPQGLGTLVSRVIAGRLSDSMGPRWLVVTGFAITTAGTIPFAFAGATANLWWLMVVLFVRGIGLGVVTVPLMSLGFRGLSRSEIPHASMLTRVAQQVGGAFGAAILTLVLAASAGAATTAVAAFHTSFVWAIGFTILGGLISLALPAKVIESPPQ